MTDTPDGDEGYAPTRAAWIEMLQPELAARVALCSPSPEPARRRLARTNGELTVCERMDRLPPGSTWDLVILEHPVARSEITAACSAVAPGGRVAVVAGNPRSPLRLADRLVGAGTGPSIGSLGRIRRALSSAGLVHHQVFGLLRSSLSTPTIFRTDLPAIADAVLGPALSNTGRGRRVAITSLRGLARRGQAQQVVPAWMLIASVTPLPDDSGTPTGRIGVEANARGAVVLGPGPDGVEKSYPDRRVLEATRTSLDLLAGCGFDLAPRILSQPSPDRLQLSWTGGVDIEGVRMEADELGTWLDRGGHVLGTFQRLTHRQDGTVLVHGDFWLGAMLREGERISGVIDWDDSHFGHPRVDMHTLTALARDRSDFSHATSERLTRCAHAGHERAGGPAEARREENGR